MDTRLLRQCCTTSGCKVTNYFSYKHHKRQKKRRLREQCPCIWVCKVAEILAKACFHAGKKKENVGQHYYAARRLSFVRLTGISLQAHNWLNTKFLTSVRNFCGKHFGNHLNHHLAFVAAKVGALLHNED